MLGDAPRRYSKDEIANLALPFSAKGNYLSKWTNKTNKDINSYPKIDKNGYLCRKFHSIVKSFDCNHRKNKIYLKKNKKIAMEEKKSPSDVMEEKKTPSEENNAQPAAKTKKRLPFIDAIRGLAIFLVVLGHAFMFNGIYPKDTNLEAPIVCLWYNALMYFRLPLFFFISGFFLSDSPLSFKDTSLQAWKKVRQLIIPYVICSYFLAQWKGYTYWFLPTLFCFFMLCFPLRYLKYKISNINIPVQVIYYIAAAGVGLLLAEFNIFDFKLEFFIFFLLGYLNKKIQYVRFVSEELAALFILIFCAWCYAYNTNLLDIKVVNYFVGFLLTTVVWNIFSKANENGRIMKWLTTLGRRTIEIYILHFYFGFRIPGLTDFIVNNVLSGNKSLVVTSLTFELFSFLILAAIMTFLSLSVHKVLKQNKYIALLLFGRQ